MGATPKPPPTPPNFVVRPVTAERWEQLADFFGPAGAYAHCWCTFFRQTGSQFAAGCRSGGLGNRALLQRLTLAGAIPGLTAHVDDGTPVGWVSVAAREQFPRVQRSPCFGQVRPTRRGCGRWSASGFRPPGAITGLRLPCSMGLWLTRPPTGPRWWRDTPPRTALACRHRTPTTAPRLCSRAQNSPSSTGHNVAAGLWSAGL